LSKKGPHGPCIELKISHDELSEMVGTTRPRISLFMQRFRKLGLIETNLDRLLVVNEKNLTDYLARRAAGQVCARRYNSRKNQGVLNSRLFRIDTR
jgi:CRP/FNR family transcriptional regulator, cyclic AMP receptor protein